MTMNVEDMRILIIGCGSIGSVLASTAQEILDIDRIFVTDQEKSYTEHILKQCDKTSYIDINNIDGALDEVELMIESASQNAAKTYVPMALKKGVDVMIMSVGSFADELFKGECDELAKKHHVKIYVPSGAVCGTDGIHAASAGEIDEIHLITTKGPKSLKNIPALKDANIDIDSFEEPTVVFEGYAREAVSKFPKNINVAATISLLGIGFDRTKVTIVCDPKTEKNSHTLIAKGSFGELRCDVHNVPSPNNHSTSYLAALSAAASLKRIVGNVWIGI